MNAGKWKIDPAKIGDIKELLEQSGGKEATLEKAGELARQATESLADSDLPAEVKDRLSGVAQALAGFE